jgi:transcriptional regulator with XRE-family HTH domain
MSRLEKGGALLEAIGTSVSKRRVELGMSQEELARKAGVHRTYISDVERGVRNVSILTLERIANAMEIPLGVLFIFGGPQVSATATARKQKG